MAKFNRNIFVLAVAAGALLAAPAVAGSNGKARSKDKSVEDGSKRVCRTLTPTGTRFTTRICKTQADWDLEMSKTQDSALSHQRDNSGASENAGPN
jgi:hypothetical protein